MKTRNYIVLTFASMIGIAMMTSCGGGNKTGSTDTQVTEEPAAAGPSAEQMALGEKIFKEKCIVCHQANGQGIPNVFPTLVGSDFLLNQKVLAVTQVLNGSLKVVANKTVKYPAPMPPQVGTHEEAVAAINYVLNNFGNKGGFITVEEVKNVPIDPR
ncbi:MAG: dissimilatory nitrite reductase (NO-forming) copper type apoprotein [Bacteroidetes bacterium]|nr:MAG: dissimilatory nitrite reductase (NO-forming) copper type apoprotein [Bacteroidota bacterium]